MLINTQHQRGLQRVLSWFGDPVYIKFCNPKFAKNQLKISCWESSRYKSGTRLLQLCIHHPPLHILASFRWHAVIFFGGAVALGLGQELEQNQNNKECTLWPYAFGLSTWKTRSDETTAVDLKKVWPVPSAQSRPINSTDLSVESL